MSNLGSAKRPATIRVQTNERAEALLQLCNEKGWQVIASIDPDDEEDISDISKLMNKSKAAALTKGGISRNGPCPCGSGKKYKRCCDAEKKTVSKQPAYSAMLIKLIEPLVDEFDTSETFYKKCLIGQAAWNHSIIDEIEFLAANSYLADYIIDIQQMPAEARPIFDMLVNRKKELFAGHTHLIMKLKIKDGAAGEQVLSVEAFHPDALKESGVLQ